MSIPDGKCREIAPLLPGREATDSYGAIVSSNNDCNCDDDIRPQKISTPTPLPVKQLLLIFVMRLAEPIAYAQVFPYVNQMMEDLQLTDDPSHVGYYSGLLESMFAVAEFCTVLKLGTLSDRIGRKPVLLFGLAGAMITTVLFGLSKSFIWALAMRTLSGALSGNVAILMSAIGDITDETNQAQAYSILGLAYNVASIIGPSIGGAFAKPTNTFPESLGSVLLFKQFPYLLPCIISALITFIAAVLGAICFEETLRRQSLISEYGSSNTTKKESAMHIAVAPVMLSVLKPFFLLSILNTAVIVVFTLFAYTPVTSGGLSKNPQEIGVAIAYSGLAGATVQVFLLPVLQRCYGTTSLYRCLMMLWPLIFMLFPILNGIARFTMHRTNLMDSDSGLYGADEYSSAGPAVWFVISVLLALNRLASMSYSLNLILTKNAAPSAAVLGTVFGISQLVNCVARSVAPVFVSSLFALSKEWNILGGNVVWIVMCAVSLLGVWTTYKVRDGASEKQT
ncbi:MFS general substrate transporter [Phellopilus nigrolimitatus]|nr:MFS general substrate transporter [Phellopilus nigrolimitatus]